jgi:hypothetical protein
MKKTVLLTLTSMMLSGWAGARTWTSADGTKTFEGDFVSCDDKTVTVNRGLRPMTFKLELLSDKDQEWAKAEAERKAAAENNQEAAAEFAKSDLGKALKKLQKLDGDSFDDHELEGAPQFFLLYYTASW